MHGATELLKVTGLDLVLHKFLDDSVGHNLQ